MVSGGIYNVASGWDATVPGGYENIASGDASFACGQEARAIHDHTFVWSDIDNGFNTFSSTAPHQFLIRASGGVGIGTNNPSNQLSVSGNADFSGNVGIGTTSPAYSLDVNGAIGVKAQGVRFTNNSHTDKWLWSPADGLLRWRTHNAATAHAFEVSHQDIGTAAVHLDIAGNSWLMGGSVGIGTTSPAALLHVNGSAGNNTGVWSNLSDERLKTGIEPIQGALETVENLRGVSFRWKDAKKDAEYGRVRGLIAQDVEKVIPEWVKTDPDGYKRLETIGMDALLIEAIKEQQEIIEKLQDRIERLEGKNRQAKIAE